MIRGLVYLAGLVTLGLVACVAAVAYRVHEWPWDDYVREGREILVEKLDPHRGPATASPARPDGAGRGGPRREESARPAGPAPAVRHEVGRGDTLYAISRRYYGDPTLWREIARANDIRKPSDLSVGRVLEIPPAPGRAGPAARPDGGPASAISFEPRDAREGFFRDLSLSLALTPAFEPEAEDAGRGGAQ